MNNLVVISGPSGSGKSTLIQMLLQTHNDLIFSISHTTRKPRGEESDGIEYHFVNHETFLDMIDADAFVEWAKVHDQFYGTSVAEIKSKSQGDKFLVLDIDIQGAKNVKKKFPQALFILVAPPSIKELENRLKRREKVITPEFKLRLKIAKEELKEFPIYDYIIINDDLDESYKILDAIFISYKHITGRNKDRINQIIQSGDNSDDSGNSVNGVLETV